MSDRATRFMREQTFNGNLIVNGNTTKDGRIRYRMQDGTVFLLTERDVETLSSYQFKPRFVREAGDHP